MFPFTFGILVINCETEGATISIQLEIAEAISPRTLCVFGDIMMPNFHYGQPITDNITEYGLGCTGKDKRKIAKTNNIERNKDTSSYRAFGFQNPTDRFGFILLMIQAYSNTLLYFFFIYSLFILSFLL